MTLLAPIPGFDSSIGNLPFGRSSDQQRGDIGVYVVGPTVQSANRFNSEFESVFTEGRLRDAAQMDNPTDSLDITAIGVLRAPDSVLDDSGVADQCGRSIITGGGLYDIYQTIAVVCPGTTVTSSATATLIDTSLVFYRQLYIPTMDASAAQDLAGIESSRRFAGETLTWIEQQVISVNGFMNSRSGVVNLEQTIHAGAADIAFPSTWAVGMYQYYMGGFAVVETESSTYGGGNPSVASRAAGGMPRIYLQGMGLPRQVDSIVLTANHQLPPTADLTTGRPGSAL